MKIVPTRRWWIGLTVASFAIAVIASGGDGEGAASSWVEVTRRDLGLEVPFTGRLRALRVAEYGPPSLAQTWEYRVELIARDGSEVAAGDPVLRFDASELEQDLRRHLAERDAAQKEYLERSKDFEAQTSEQELALEEAKALERRAQVGADVPAELVARSTLEKAAIDLALSREEVAHRGERIAYLKRRRQTELALLLDRRDRATTAVAETERAIELMTVRATAAGTVSLRADERGQKRKVGDNCWRGERVLEIPEPGALLVDAWVEEAESGGLRPGHPATLYLDAHPDRALRGSITSVLQAVERRTDLDKGPIVRLELGLDETGPDRARPGMRVQGTILTEEQQDRLVVPVAAVSAGAAGPVVTGRTLLGAAQRPIVLGRRWGEWVEVVAGLEAGDQVLVSR
jgi:hypothetical protein